MEIQKSEKKDKRFKAIFEDGKVVHFGQKGGSTYIDHKDKKIRENYLKRHEKNPLEKKFLQNKKKYYKSPSILSAEILWGKKDNLQDSIKDFKNKYIRKN